MAYDWNKNGRQDSFDRYMDYKASHPENNNHGQSNKYDGNNGYGKYDHSLPHIDTKEPENKSYSSQEKQDYLSPTTIIAAIISIIFGVVLAVVWLNAIN